MATSRLYLPQPFEELDHTADAGIVARGDTAELAMARLVLGFAQIVAGGGEITPRYQRRIDAEPGERAMMAIDVLRELLYVFDRERLIPTSCLVVAFDPERGARVDVELGDYDEARHAEGLTPKAITLHAARFESRGSGWVAQVVLDI